MNTNFTPPVARHAPVLLAIVGLCALLETVFTLADTPFADFSVLRRTAMVYGAFWPGLLGGWDEVFPGQRFTMFLSHAFLHGGFLHMAFNMLILLGLGREAVLRLGQGGVLLLFVLSAVGGGAVYGLLSTSDAPMLGASGAVFGFFGASVYWNIQARRARGLSIEQPIRLTLGLVVMNVILWALVGGMLAWQAHLGGFITGALLARVVTPTPGHRHRVRSGTR
ncbi:rhomboid family intramembrane serine protease [Pararhodobacter zhoushanensis]|uniref:Rhomboid family intramembrane serine protease n=1 Tax=Pararhodobacter zhoushanensis TaxID=2479545 RepID=A0ABT3GY22_9RHOB|nr:rhomboid family intramembrane serine protease [Pararhodobacter zhoushanensis]MCW1932434.1 rhomboid family intramembrane serine protease [Pararhodobacter zhoushanensis]